MQNNQVVLEQGLSPDTIPNRNRKIMWLYLALLLTGSAYIVSTFIEIIVTSLAAIESYTSLGEPSDETSIRYNVHQSAMKSYESACSSNSTLSPKSHADVITPEHDVMTYGLVTNSPGIVGSLLLSCLGMSLSRRFQPFFMTLVSFILLVIIELLTVMLYQDPNSLSNNPDVDILGLNNAATWQQDDTITCENYNLTTTDNLEHLPMRFLNNYDIPAVFSVITPIIGFGASFLLVWVMIEIFRALTYVTGDNHCVPSICQTTNTP